MVVVLANARGESVLAQAAADHAARCAAYPAAPGRSRSVPAILGRFLDEELDAKQAYLQAAQAVWNLLPNGPGSPETRLSTLTRDWKRLLMTGRPIDADALRLHADLAPAVSAVLAGTVSASCEWTWDPERGLADPAMPPGPVQALSLAMSTSSRDVADEHAAVRLAVAVVAFGRDVERDAGTAASMLGGATRWTGYLAIARTLTRPLSDASLAALAEALDATRPARDLTRAVREQRLMSEVHVLSRNVGALCDARFPAAFWAWEWTSTDQRWAELEALSMLPRPQRAPRAAAFDAAAAGALSICTRLLFVGDAQALDLWDEVRAGHDLARVLVAARRFEAQRGHPPARSSDLDDLLGGPTVDPFRVDQGPLTLVRDDRGVLAYSWGLNGSDEGGDGGEDDRQPDLVLRIPRPR